MLHRGPYTYSFTKKEELFQYQEIRGGSEEHFWGGGTRGRGRGRGDLRPNKLGNFVAFENASRVFRNGLVWFIGCL